MSGALMAKRKYFYYLIIITPTLLSHCSSGIKWFACIWLTNFPNTLKLSALSYLMLWDNFPPVGKADK